MAKYFEKKNSLKGVSSEEQNMKISNHIKGELTLDHFIKTESIDAFLIYFHNSHIRTSGYLIIHWGEVSRNPLDFTYR